MTDAEKAYLEAVIAGTSGERELSELRQAVLVERAGPEVEKRWKDGYRQFLTASRQWEKLRDSLELAPDFMVGRWRAEVCEEFCE